MHVKCQFTFNFTLATNREFINTMLYRSVIRMLALSRNSYLRQYNGAVNIFGNYRSITPLSTTRLALSDEKVKVFFNTSDGRRIEAEGKVGDSLLDVVVNNNVDIDGYGACEGTITCSTCHVLFSQTDYDRLTEEPGDEERDMLDLAYGLTDTSRLGCQVMLRKELDGLEVTVPESVNDARS